MRQHQYLRAVLSSNYVSHRTLFLVGRMGIRRVVISVRIQIIVACGKLLEETVDLCKEGHDDFGNKVVGFSEEGVLYPEGSRGQMTQRLPREPIWALGHVFVILRAIEFGTIERMLTRAHATDGKLLEELHDFCGEGHPDIYLRVNKINTGNIWIPVR